MDGGPEAKRDTPRSDKAPRMRTRLDPARALADLIEGYAPRPDTADQMLAPDGSLRPGWSSLMTHLALLTPEQRDARFLRGDTHLREAGVFFRHYSTAGSGERDWPLSHVPVILHEDEWRGIADGLKERADLLERVVADLYGPQTLVQDGLLPAEIVGQNPEFLRPLVGVPPVSGHYLHFIAFEIARNPDGSWFVLGDRTQAPSGAGFALENRIASTRIFPDVLGRGNVHRLAGFFRNFRATLDSLRDAVMAGHPEASSARPAILTPGRATDTYFEHAYIARYLGLMLLEGEDLAVENGQLKVRTVSGLRPAPVIWRRLDGDFCDPLELNENSHIGTPGMISALRSGRLAMVNMPGAGLLETRALLAFLPRIAEALNGRPLSMPNIATWWLGQEAARDYARTEADRMVFGPALGAAMTEDMGPLAPGVTLDHGWAAQEAVALSTTPTFVDGKLEAHPMTVRVFAARTAQGWQIMPGGYARIGRGPGTEALAMQDGGSVADVWVVADKAVPQDSLIARPVSLERRTQRDVPARAADNLYWLGRYVERAEGTMRLLRARALRLEEEDDPETPALYILNGLLEASGIDIEPPVAEALLGQIAAAEFCSSKLRDRFSIDAWSSLRDLSQSAQDMARTPAVGMGQASHRMAVLLRKISGFSGLVHENMYRGMGWRFLSAGRALERADHVAMLLLAFTAREARGSDYHLLLELGDSVMTHRRLFRTDPSPETLRDLLALDPANPRSLMFQLEELRNHASALPGSGAPERLGPFSRAVLRLHTELSVADASDIGPTRLVEIRKRLFELSNLMTRLYLK